MSSRPSNTARRKFAAVHRLDRSDVSRLWMRSRIPSAAPPPASVGEPTHSASTGGMLEIRCCSCAGSLRNAPAPLHSRDPLVPSSCAHSNRRRAVAPPAARRHAGRCPLPSQRMQCLPCRDPRRRKPVFETISSIGSLCDLALVGADGGQTLMYGRDSRVERYPSHGPRDAQADLILRLLDVAGSAWRTTDFVQRLGKTCEPSFRRP